MLSALINATRVPLVPLRGLEADLRYKMQHQQHSQWCWSAVATSTALFFTPGSGWTQCKLVNEELGQATCCNNGNSQACNQPWYLDRALARTGNLRKLGSGALAWEAVQKEIDAKRPLGVRIEWSGGAGHFVVLDGYKARGGRYVLVKDPFSGSSTYDYSAFRDAYMDSGSWTHTYYTQPIQP